jgi:hypothetical protein
MMEKYVLFVYVVSSALLLAIHHCSYLIKLMSIDKDAEWTIHTSRRSKSRRPTTATVTPTARKPTTPEPTIGTKARKPTLTSATGTQATARKPPPKPEPATGPIAHKPTPKSEPATGTQGRKPTPKPVPATGTKPNPTPKPATGANAKPNTEPTGAKAESNRELKPKPETGTNDNDTASIASADSDSSMTDDDPHTKRVKDFVPPSKLVPITNQVTSDDVITFSCNFYVHFMRKEILRTNNTYKLHGEYTGFTEFTKSTDGEFTDWIKYDRTNQTELNGPNLRIE